MNAHVNPEIVARWPSHEFRGIPRRSRHGFTYIEARHKILNQTFFYVFEADSFVDKEGILCGAPELIFEKLDLDIYYKE
jgi:hypothetical protein